MLILAIDIEYQYAAGFRHSSRYSRPSDPAHPRNRPPSRRRCCRSHRTTNPRRLPRRARITFSRPPPSCRQAWIAGEWGELETGRRAKFYALTKTGRAQLAVENATGSVFTAMNQVRGGIVTCSGANTANAISTPVNSWFEIQASRSKRMGCLPQSRRMTRRGFYGPEQVKQQVRERRMGAGIRSNRK